MRHKHRWYLGYKGKEAYKLADILEEATGTRR